MDDYRGVDMNKTTTTAEFQANILRDRYFAAREAETAAATRLAVLRERRELAQSEYEEALRRNARDAARSAADRGE
jgi:hypothetical protein